MIKPVYADDEVVLFQADCLAVLALLADDSVDSIVTDPPYGLEFMGKEWDTFDQSPRKVKGTGGTQSPFANHAASLDRARGKAFQAWCETWAAECLRVLKPGGYLVAFGGTRTYHRMVCAIEDAGFEIRDSLHWHYGSGFPKGLDISKAIDKAAGVERMVIGSHPYASRKPNGTWTGEVYGDEPEHQQGPSATAPVTDAAKQWSGWNVALKPGHEPIVLARKPLSEKTVTANVLRYGTGALNIDGCRVSTTDKLGGGDQNASTKVKTEGWDRPWMQDEEAKAAHAARVNENVEKAESLGRWPPNILLSHSGFAWYALRRDIPEDIRQEILAYYGPPKTVREVRNGLLRDAIGNCQAPILLTGLREWGASRSPESAVGPSAVPALRGDVRGLSGMGAERSAQVLFSPVSGPGTEDQEPGPDGRAAHGSFAGQDGQESSGQGPVFSVEGRSLSGTGLLACDDRPTTSENGRTGSADGRAESDIHPGAPGDSSGSDRPSADQGRGSSPHQRGEARQPPGKLDRSQPEESLCRAPGDREAVCDAVGRGRDATEREPVLAVPAGLISERWLVCFEYLSPGGCVPAGEKKVRNSSGSIKGDEPSAVTDAVYAERVPWQAHGDADGMETVQAWTCAEDCPVGEMDRQSGVLKSGGNIGAGSEPKFKDVFSKIAERSLYETHKDAGGASRYFPQFEPDYDFSFRYQAKAPKKERPKAEGAQQHPTVKPLALMRWLVRLVTPPHGVVLDMFCGSGTTLQAAGSEGFRSIGIDSWEDAIMQTGARLGIEVELAGEISAGDAALPGCYALGVLGRAVGAGGARQAEQGQVLVRADGPGRTGE